LCLPSITAELVTKPARRIGLAGIVLIILSVMLVIHAFSGVLRMSLGLLFINEILALGLSELVDLGAGEASEELLGEGVVDRLSCFRVRFCVLHGAWRGWGRTLFALAVLEDFEGTEGGGTADELVAELGFVVVVAVALVDLLVGVLRFTWRKQRLLAMYDDVAGWEESASREDVLHLPQPKGIFADLR